MGNTPSKNDPLPNISCIGASASSAASSADGDSDESSLGLSRPTGNGRISLSHEKSPNGPGARDSLSTPRLLPAVSPAKSIPPKSLKSKRDYQLEVDIDTSMAALLALSPWAATNTLDYTSSTASLPSDHFSVSPVFTANDAKDESLVLSISSLANLPTAGKPQNPFQAPLETSLPPIVEALASAESTPEPRLPHSPAIAKSSDLGRALVARRSSVLSSPSPPLAPLAPSGRREDLDVDSVIERLVAIGMRKPGSPQKRRGKDKLPLATHEVKQILARARSIFLEQPTLLKLSPPVKIVGDLHGQFHDLIRIFNSCGYPPQTNYLFLGDYVDRGYKSLETMLLLLCYKIKYPENFFMLRGNHESANITKIYGFYDECKRRLPLISGSHKLWKNFVDVFNTLPIAATINDKIFCIHGGLSPELHSLLQIERIQRPTDIPDKGLLADLLWSDPDPLVRAFSHTNWPKNDRGVSYCFGKKHVDHFLLTFNMDLIVRGHMVVEDGYEFFDKRKLVTVFSAPNYCGEFNNYGAIMSVDKSLCCSFELLKPH